MADNIALYLAKSQPITQSLLSRVTANIDQPEIIQSDNAFVLKWSNGWQITLNLMPQQALASHMNGLLGFAQQAGADSKTLARMKQTQQALGVVIEPGFENFGYARSVALGLTDELDGFFFAGQGFYNSTNKLIVGTLGMPPQFFPDPISATPISLARKARSIQKLQQQKIPYIDHLPVIEDEQDITVREVEEAAIRAMALCLVAGLAMDLQRDVFNHVIRDYQLQSAFSTQEMQFIGTKPPTEEQNIEFSWRIEAYATLAWALGYLDELPPANTPIDVAFVSEIMRVRPRETFIAEAKLRSATEILDVLDLHYRYAWAVRELHLQQKHLPSALHPGIVFERYQALNWLVSDPDTDWDYVDLST